MSETTNSLRGLWTKDLRPRKPRWRVDASVPGTQWIADRFSTGPALIESPEPAVVHNFEIPTFPTNYLNENFDDLTESYATVPSNWNTDTSNHIYGSSNTAGQRSWEPESGTTNSSGTGPYRAHGGSDSSGAFSTEPVAHKYMYIETSSLYHRNWLLRTPELNFSNAKDNNTLQLTFWFHMHGSAIGELMVGTSNSATSANNGTIGTGFSAPADHVDRTGMSIEFWDDDSDDGSSTSTGIVIEGQQQSEGHTATTVAAYWRKATVNLNAVAGESSCYIWFYAKSAGSFRGDICIDTVKVDGEE